MNKKNYIDKIELILNTSGKYITRKEKDMILDYVNYFKTKNNVIEDKNIELVIEIERLNNIINDIDTYIHLWKLDDIGEKTMLILNDILLIKNGMSDEVVRLKDSDKE